MTGKKTLKDAAKKTAAEAAQPAKDTDRESGRKHPAMSGALGHTERKIEKAALALLIITALLVLFNSLQISALNTMPMRLQAVGNSGELAAGSIIPTGIPAIYGAELGVSFDDVSAYDQAAADRTIRKLGQLDQALTLDGELKQRYINALYHVGNGMSCEYCCGARAIIFENGEAACGCAHSYAMRGLAKYLLIKHGSEYTDEQISEELGKWKVLFFPTQMGQKAEALQAKGIELNMLNLASNAYRGIEKGTATGGGMVGGC